MGRVRQRAVLIFFISLGFTAFVFLLWLDLAPAEPPAPFTVMSLRLPPLTPLARPTALPLADQPRLTIAVKPYRHPSGTFAVKYPEGWQIDEAEDAVLFVAPDDAAQYSITFKRGVTASLEVRRYVQNGWGAFPKFAFEETVIQNGVAFHFEQMVLPEKTWQLMKGQTIVQQRNGVILWQTWLVRLDRLDIWREVLGLLNSSLTLNPPK